jgi:hypothetical protein
MQRHSQNIRHLLMLQRSALDVACTTKKNHRLR